MRKTISIFLFLALSFTQYIFADTSDMSNTSEGKACGVIAKACIAGGYGNKKFWSDCMRPILLGKQVNGVTVDATTLKACRVAKVNQLTKELQDIKDAMQK